MELRRKYDEVCVRTWRRGEEEEEEEKEGEKEEEESVSAGPKRDRSEGRSKPE